MTESARSSGTTQGGRGASDAALRLERRSSARTELRAPVPARLRGHVALRILNISSRGVLAETTAPLRPSTRHELAIELPDVPVLAMATVVRCRTWGRALDPAGRTVLVYRAALSFDPGCARAEELIAGVLPLLCHAPDTSVPSEVPPPEERERLLLARRQARTGGPVRIRVAAAPAGP